MRHCAPHCAQVREDPSHGGVGGPPPPGRRVRRGGARGWRRRGGYQPARLPSALTNAGGLTGTA